ncbi:divergent polysaccharide deacetylase family protein [Rhodospirillaceae bacterium SYSU D60014]|uniref:divergent polysaccharide deacetylase family protein n=1 Tax=Virgifigura deserti TaxID=2268457 RepID=UPI0013C498B5
MIAIVIDDLGLNRINAKRVIALPGPLTLAFMTYAKDLDRQTRAARAAGHELIVHLPMEPLGDRFDSGPNTLEVDLPPDELLRRLRWGLTRFGGYVGINNHMGSRFTGWDTGMALVLEELRARGLLFLDSRTIGNSVAKQVAQTVGVPYAGRDVFLDNESSAEAVRERLAETETIARRYGFAVAIGHPHDGTIEALSGWLPTLAERGYVLVPISGIVRRNLAASG